MIKYRVPFYAASSSRDGNCVSSVFKMVLGYFLPEKKFAWKQVGELTGYVKRKGTWFFPALTKLKKLGFDVVVVDTFDYVRASQEGREYLLKYFKNPETLEWALQKTDFLQKRKLLPEFTKTVRPKQEIPQLSDIQKYLKAGYLVAVELDWTVLHQEKGEYVSHLVLVVGFGKDYLIIHDPDDRPNWKVKKSLFEKAWSYDGRSSHNMTAFKYS